MGSLLKVPRFFFLEKYKAGGLNTSAFFNGVIDLETRPSFEEFEKMSKQGNLIPVYREFLADMDTPVSAYLKIRDKSFSYLLESADGGKRWGRYSFIGYMPFMTVIFRNEKLEVIEGDRTTVIADIDNPLIALRSLSKKFNPVMVPELSPFQGGFVGFFNYDLIRKWENIPGVGPQSPDDAETAFTVSSRLIIFDHLTHQMKVAAFAHLQENDDLKAAYDNTIKAINETLEELRNPLPSNIRESSFKMEELKSNVEKEDFENAVTKAKDHIVAGDIIQAVLSQRFSAEFSGDDFLLYRNLRSINPSPYMFYLNFGDVRMIGASPEILVRLTDGKIELRPIAGTRPRGETPEEDKSLAEELLADPKERAEHIMLVDLGRNDVGKVSEPGSVSVPRLMVIEQYSHVMHIVSSVEGTLSNDMDCFDLFMSSFPAGTVSGAPKIRAMEIINDLETSARGPYAGAVGYFGFNGNMDFCITIRTITINRDTLSLQAGAGIVYDSVPENEYRETLNKAGAMLQAIRRAKD